MSRRDSAKRPHLCALAAALALAAGIPASAQAATITPDTNADEINAAAPCSLREAVQSANLDADAGGCVATDLPYGDDVIVLGAQNYQLTIAGVGEQDNQTGDLDVADATGANGLTIRGFDADSTVITVSSNPLDRVIDHRIGDLTLEDLGIGGGSAPSGAGVNSDAAVNDPGDLTVTRAGFFGNVARSTTTAFGGAIAYDGAPNDLLTIEETRFLINAAFGDADTATAAGGAVHVVGGRVEIDDSDFGVSGAGAGDDAEARGAAVFVADGDVSDGVSTIESSTFTQNLAESAAPDIAGAIEYLGPQTGLGLEIVDSVVIGDNEDLPAAGIDLEAGSMAIEGSMISDNNLGGIRVGPDGGAAHLEVRDSTVNENSAPQGGGMFVGDDGELDATNLTLSANVATGAGGGGGIRALGEPIRFRHATILDNLADAGPGDQIRHSGDLTEIGGTVIGDPDAADMCDFGPEPLVLMEDVLTQGDECGSAPGQSLFLSLMLGPLAPNDGPVVGSSFTDPPSILLTHGLLDGSAAIDAVPAARCVDALDAPLTTDERGFPRPSPSNGNCDAGAFEVQQPEPPQEQPEPPQGMPPAVSELPPTVESRQCRGRDATLVGTPGDDALSGTDRRDVIVARGGDDRIRARGGKDVVCGADGADRIRGGKGRDVLVGGAGPDRLFGGPGRDRLIGGTPGSEVPSPPGTTDSDRCVGGRGHDSREGCGGSR